MWLEPGAYSGRTSTCVYACHHSCKTQTALLAHFFLPFLGSGFGGADDFRFAPRAAAGFDDEDTNLFLLRAASASLRAFFASRVARLAATLSLAGPLSARLRFLRAAGAAAGLAAFAARIGDANSKRVAAREGESGARPCRGAAGCAPRRAAGLPAIRATARRPNADRADWRSPDCSRRRLADERGAGDGCPHVAPHTRGSRQFAGASI